MYLDRRRLCTLGSNANFLYLHQDKSKGLVTERLAFFIIKYLQSVQRLLQHCVMSVLIYPADPFMY